MQVIFSSDKRLIALDVRRALGGRSSTLLSAEDAHVLHRLYPLPKRSYFFGAVAALERSTTKAVSACMIFSTRTRSVYILT